MKWSKPSEDLLVMLEELFEDFPFERKKMFGQYALFHHGNMFAGVFQDDIFIRYSPELQKGLKDTYDEIEQFEPLKGRAMREYIIIPESIYSDSEVMDSLLKDCIAFVEKIPPK